MSYSKVLPVVFAEQEADEADTKRAHGPTKETDCPTVEWEGVDARNAVSRDARADEDQSIAIGDRPCSHREVIPAGGYV
jgi:hypothetical protein